MNKFGKENIHINLHNTPSSSSQQLISHSKVVHVPSRPSHLQSRKYRVINSTLITHILDDDDKSEDFEETAGTMMLKPKQIFLDFIPT